MSGMRLGIRHAEELSLCRAADADDLRGNTDAWLQGIRKQIFAEMNPDAPLPQASSSGSGSGSGVKRSASKVSTTNGGGGSRKDLTLNASPSANALTPTQSHMSLRDGATPPGAVPELYTSASIYEGDKQQQQPMQKSPTGTLRSQRLSQAPGGISAVPSYATLSRTSLSGGSGGLGGTLSRSQASVFGAGALTLTRSGNLASINEELNAAGSMQPVSWRQLHEASAAPLRTRTVQQRARLNAGYASLLLFFSPLLFSYLLVGSSLSSFVHLIGNSF